MSENYYDKNIRVIQPSKSLEQADWGTLNVDTYFLPICKGVELMASGTAGYLEIHLIDDPEGKWYLLYLSPDDNKGRIFNKIRTTNTTVDLSKVVCFPIE